MKKIKKVNLYRTKDYNIASTLYALSCKLDSSEVIKGVCFFVFEDEDNCLKIRKSLFDNRLKVNPMVLFDAQRTIKSIIYDR